MDRIQIFRKIKNAILFLKGANFCSSLLKQLNWDIVISIYTRFRFDNIIIMAKYVYYFVAWNVLSHQNWVHYIKVEFTNKLCTIVIFPRDMQMALVYYQSVKAVFYGVGYIAFIPIIVTNNVRSVSTYITLGPILCTTRISNLIFCLLQILKWNWSVWMLF